MSKWQFVPREPTAEMYSASTSQEWDEFEQNWRAMLDAAPARWSGHEIDICDAYAIENQQLSDELETLRAEVQRLRESAN